MNFKVSDIIHASNGSKFYGLITDSREVHVGYGKNKTYYTILWLNTGFEFEYSESQIKSAYHLISD